MAFHLIRFHFHQGFTSQTGSSKRQNKVIGLWQTFRIAGEVDSLVVAEREQLNEILEKLWDIDGVSRNKILSYN
ncbi:MAG: hypothetical protein NWE84_03075 [Candidatus Bathyarchaeota archaeon]|nr:hypothetical protein [Candidatus Bathyarchaeota archaeon]